MSINLRSDDYRALIQVIINEVVNSLLVIQTSNVQLIKFVQLYLRQLHHSPIQCRYILTCFWAARLVIAWCWRGYWCFRIIHTDCHVAISAEASVA